MGHGSNLVGELGFLVHFSCDFFVCETSRASSRPGRLVEGKLQFASQAARPMHRAHRLGWKCPGACFPSEACRQPRPGVCPCTPQPQGLGCGAAGPLAPRLPGHQSSSRRRGPFKRKRICLLSSLPAPMLAAPAPRSLAARRPAVVCAPQPTPGWEGGRDPGRLPGRDWPPGKWAAAGADQPAACCWGPAGADWRWPVAVSASRVG